MALASRGVLTVVFLAACLLFFRGPCHGQEGPDDGIDEAEYSEAYYTYSGWEGNSEEGFRGEEEWMRSGDERSEGFENEGLDSEPGNEDDRKGVRDMGSRREAHGREPGDRKTRERGLTPGKAFIRHGIVPKSVHASGRDSEEKRTEVLDTTTIGAPLREGRELVEE